ncbi:MAG: hypothetical protein JRC60_07210, partial [Deltaproteobacteria bacterium]|nr:hypothetical protein [Deltaproteobacteria bacterium]
MNKKRKERAPVSASQQIDRGAENSGNDISTAGPIYTGLQKKVNSRKLKRSVVKEELIAITGNCCAAIILAQMMYWAERVADHDRFISEENQRRQISDTFDQEIPKRHGWIYKSAKDLCWETMLGLSENSVRKYLKQLISQGFLESRRNPKYHWDRTKQYRVNLQNIHFTLQKYGYPLDGYQIIEFADRNANSADRNANSADRTDKNCGALPETTPENTTHTQTGCVVSSDNCSPPQTATAANELARDVMEYQILKGRQVANPGLYLATLEKLAKEGKLIIPEGYVSPAEKEKTEKRRSEAD